MSIPVKYEIPKASSFFIVFTTNKLHHLFMTNAHPLQLSGSFIKIHSSSQALKHSSSSTSFSISTYSPPSLLALNPNRSDSFIFCAVDKIIIVIFVRLGCQCFQCMQLFAEGLQAVVLGIDGPPMASY